jgi:hypothetical protein
MIARAPNKNSGIESDLDVASLLRLLPSEKKKHALEASKRRPSEAIQGSRLRMMPLRLQNPVVAEVESTSLRREILPATPTGVRD